MFRLSQMQCRQRKLEALLDVKRLAKLVNQGALNVHPMLCLLEAESMASKTTRGPPATVETTRKQFDAAIHRRCAKWTHPPGATSGLEFSPRNTSSTHRMADGLASTWSALLKVCGLGRVCQDRQDVR